MRDSASGWTYFRPTWQPVAFYQKVITGKLKNIRKYIFEMACRRIGYFLWHWGLNCDCRPDNRFVITNVLRSTRPEDNLLDMTLHQCHWYPWFTEILLVARIVMVRLRDAKPASWKSFLSQRFDCAPVTNAKAFTNADLFVMFGNLDRCARIIKSCITFTQDIFCRVLCYSTWYF